MHQHDPSDYTGPLRGTTAWWRSPQQPAGNQATQPGCPTSDKSSEGIRHDLVERVRREIAAGTYDTPEKWNAALDRLLERLERD